MLTPHYVESYVRPPTQACPHAVRIELDEPGASYQAGDIISGSVIVIPAFDEGFSALTIELQRYAHGRVTSVGLIAEQRLFAGPWRTGAKGVFPFRLEAPRAAARYHGHLLHLELRLAAILPRSDAPLLARPLESARAYPVAVHPITVNDPRPVVVSIDTTRARDAEQRGFKVFFNKAHCSACHTGHNFSDGAFHNIGVGMDAEKPDLGRYEISKLEGDKGSFKTPTLREIARTAPYMHDGRFKTLEEVVEYYDKGGHANPQLDEEMHELKLSPQDKADLVIFLKEGLSSESYPDIAPPKLP